MLNLSNAGSGREVFNIGQLTQQCICLKEMKARDKEKCNSETSSSSLEVTETIGVAKVVICEDYSNLQRLFQSHRPCPSVSEDLEVEVAEEC